jgi:stage IV sporulation protein FB
VNLLRWLSQKLFHCVNVGRIFGIEVRIHWSFWALPVGLAVASMPHGWPLAVQAVVLVLLFYLQGVLIHEYGHAWAARLYGVRTRDIILTPIGGIARMESLPEKPLQEIVIALAGPATNFLFAIPVAFLLISLGAVPFATARGNPPLFTSWTDYAWALTIANVAMACFNLLPAFPSDGGRVFRAFLSLFLDRVTATQVAVYAGLFVAILIGMLGVVNRAIQLPFIALLFATIGQMELWMVRRQAALRRSLRGASARWQPSYFVGLQPPETGFTGYSWNSECVAWVEWRDGFPVRICRMFSP